MEVEAACDAVDVEHFAGEEKVGVKFGLEGLLVNAVEGDSATGDELVLVGAAAGNGVGVVGEDVDQSVDAFLDQFVAAFALQLGLVEEIGPKSSGKETLSPDPFPVEGEGNRAGCLWVGKGEAKVIYEFLGILFYIIYNVLANGVVVGFACPVDEEGRLVVLLGEVSGGVRGEFEDGRAAHAPVGNEDGSLAAKGGGGNADDGIVDHQPHEGGEGRVVDGEGEEAGADLLNSLPP